MNAETVEAGRQLDEILALVEAASGVEELRPLYYRVNTIARNHAADEAAMQAATRVLSRIVERGNELCRSSLVPVRNWEDEKPRAEGPSAVSPVPAPVSETLALIPTESRQPEIHRPVIDIRVDRSTTVNQAPRASTSRKRPPAWLLAFAGTLMGISMVVGLIRIFVPAPSPEIQPRAAAAPASAPIVLPSLRVESDLDGGHVLIDGKLAGPLENGEFHLRDMPAGDYLISVVSGVHQADYEFKVAPDGAPQWKSAPVSPTMFAAGVAVSAGQTLAVASRTGGRISIDNRPPVTLAAGGVALGQLSAGEHQLEYADAAGTRRFLWKPGSGAGLYLLLRATGAKGAIVAITEVDAAEILLDGKPVLAKSTDGRLRIPRVPPGEYLITARKPGFLSTPERLVVVRSGQDSRVNLPLRPRPGIQ